jgi:hypothetical protein
VTCGQRLRNDATAWIAYNPSPVVMKYRGYSDRLFKRDFCGEMMDTYTDLKLIVYGFAYHRDVNFPQDDISWFLLEKKDPETKPAQTVS